MATIDADAHVIECDETWSYVEDFEKQFQPVRVDVETGGRAHHFWYIDGRVVPTGPFSETDAIAAVREMTDIPGRLKQMDEIGTDHQVIYPTLFLRPVTRRPELERRALCRSYNRWLAGRVAEGGGRFSWAVVPPTMIVDEAINEIRFGYENGATAVFWRGFEHGRLADDPYFAPIFEEINRLGLAVGVHAANGTFEVLEQFPDENGIFRFKVPGIIAFQTVLASNMAAQYPDIRWGFIELSAQWVPYVLHDFVRRGERRTQNIDPTTLMAKNNLYVACQTDDDLAYIHGYTGDERLVAGTDFGHADTSSELMALQILRENGAIASSSIERILDDNARELYRLRL